MALITHILRCECVNGTRIRGVKKLTEQINKMEKKSIYTVWFRIEKEESIEIEKEKPCNPVQPKPDWFDARVFSVDWWKISCESQKASRIFFSYY